MGAGYGKHFLSEEAANAKALRQTMVGVTYQQIRQGS